MNYAVEKIKEKLSTEIEKKNKLLDLYINGTISKEEFINSIVRIIVKSDGSQLSKELNVSNGEIVKVEVNTNGRSLIFGDVVVRVSDSYALAMHIDTDESNAALGVKEGYIVK